MFRRDTVGLENFLCFESGKTKNMIKKVNLSITSSYNIIIIGYNKMVMNKNIK